MSGLPRRLWRRLQRLEEQSSAGQWAVGRARQTVDKVVRHRAVGTILDFADAVVAQQDQLHADIIVSCDVTSLPGAHLLAQGGDSQVVCDVREVPDLGSRSLPKAISSTDLFFLNAALRQHLADCTHLMTVGPSLAALIEEQVGKPAVVVPNYLEPQDVRADGRLRAKIAAPTEAPLIAVPNTIVGVAEVLIHAVAQSAIPFQIAFVGATKPASYRTELANLTEQLGIADRVHWIGAVPYRELAATLADADLGAILLDPSIANHRLAYPNRVFDALSGGLPIVSSPITDIDELVARHECGVMAHANTAQAWSAALEAAWTDREPLQQGSARARSTLTWSSVEPALRTVLPEGTGSVTFLHPKNLHLNQRTLRIAQLLAATGTDVRIGTAFTGPAPELATGIEVVRIAT